MEGLDRGFDGELNPDQQEPDRGNGEDRTEPKPAWSLASWTSVVLYSFGNSGYKTGTGVFVHPHTAPIAWVHSEQKRTGTVRVLAVETTALHGRRPVHPGGMPAFSQGSREERAPPLGRKRYEYDPGQGS